MSSQARRQILRYGPVVVLAVVLLAGLFTLRDYGITSDELIRSKTGDNWLRFLATWDKSYVPQGWLSNYGAAVDMMGSALARAQSALGGTDPFLPRHALVFLIGLLGLVGTYRLGKTLEGPAVGLIALTLLALTPRYYGASFTNPKDVPFAAAFVWSMFGVVRLLQAPSRRTAAWAGVFAALCNSVRPVGLLFIPLGALACWYPVQELPKREKQRLLATQLGVALVLAFATWPILWLKGPLHMIRAAYEITRDHTDPPHGLFLGEIVSPDALHAPASYVAVWIAVTFPLPTLALALGGAYRLFKFLRTTSRPVARWTAGLAGLWVAGPLLLPLLHAVPMYSAIRHFIFVFPALCLLAASALRHLLRTLEENWQRFVLVAVGLLGYGDVVLTEWRMHPYEDLYFSRLVGGLHGAAGKFDTTYYQEAYRELVEWAAKDAAKSSGSKSLLAPVLFDVPSYYAGRLGLTMGTVPLHYYVSDVLLSRNERLPGEVLYAISREGVTLGVVKKLGLEPPASTYVGPPWSPVTAKDGIVTMPLDAKMLAITVDSPRSQEVPLYWGYIGKAKVAVNPAGKVYELPPLANVAVPAWSRTMLDLRAGHNAVLVDLTDVDHAAPLYVHQPTGLNLKPGPRPPGD